MGNNNYDKQPYIEVPMTGDHPVFRGYNEIVCEIRECYFRSEKTTTVVALDFYPGVMKEEIQHFLISQLPEALTIDMEEEIYVSGQAVEKRISETITDDRVFGRRTLAFLEDFVDWKKKQQAVEKIQATEGLIVIYGVGASILWKPDIWIFCDLARWEIQRRYRKGMIPNWMTDNYHEDPLRKLKRGMFFEWPIADKYKKEYLKEFDYVLDSNIPQNPKLITGEKFREGLRLALNRPFRVVPFFDPGVWGGQWMKEVCGLDQEEANFAWCFDCVPEENSLYLKLGDCLVEIPAIDLVYFAPEELLGEKIYARFGAEFPIRFDFLDTMGGQNLSLQVHPTVDYMRDHFGLSYTQEESYYLLDTDDKKDTCVYLGVTEGTTKESFFQELRKAGDEDRAFDAAKYANKIPAKKHDHFLIPPGTLHCSGADTMVLEISSTPSIYTFKLWDWGRVGLDGKPRPINLERGEKVLDFSRDTSWVYENLVNCIEVVETGDGYREEKTGLHEKQFIETRRHWFHKTVLHNTYGTLNVLNLIEGEEAIVESPDQAFQPFVVHYAETFIIPAAVGSYSISPYGRSLGKEIGTIKAFVRGTQKGE